MKSALIIFSETAKQTDDLISICLFSCLILFFVSPRKYWL